jgi:hypothetical protein
VLKTLYTLLDKEEVDLSEGTNNTTLWIYAPSLDAILILEKSVSIFFL